MTTPKRLQERVALITGAASGIGKATAELFAAEGAKLFLTDIDETRGAETARALGARFRRHDVADEAAWRTVAQEVETHFGVLDVLVNNAGVSGFHADWGPQDPEHASLESWRRVHAINLDGVFLGIREMMPFLKKSKAASIVNVSSRAGIVGIAMAGAYASSKAAVRNHTKTVALYCATKGYPIRCNSIHPGAILTPIWEPMIGTGEMQAARMKAYTRDVPLQRFGTSEEMAKSILFLASDDSSYLTGSELCPDGGLGAGPFFIGKGG